MRIGILTFHRSINYGAFMQCYSLCQRLQRDFPQHSIEVIDYTSDRIQEMYDREIREADPLTQKLLSQRAEAFRSVYSHLPLSPQCLIGEGGQELSDWMNSRYDAVIVGSDAVWNWILRGFPNPYFLKDYHGIKLSYAASAHGQRFRTMTPQQKLYLQESFRDFAYLGVRDVTTEQLLRYVDPELKPQHNCDPTMFLDPEALPCDMEALKQKLSRQGVDFSKPLIGIMGSPKNIGRELKQHFGNRVQFVALYWENNWADVYLHDLNPFEWARVFSLFSATVTHFFHGTLLSLVNGTPVFAAETASTFALEYTTKIADVLGRLDLLQYRSLSLGCRRSFLQRVWSKLGFSVDRAMWESICREIETVLEGQVPAIAQKVEREARSYENFRAALESCLNR